MPGHLIQLWLRGRYLEHICKEKPSAARLLSLMCLFDREGILLSLLLRVYKENSYGEADLDDEISTLRNYSFIKINVEGNEFEMHRLVQVDKGMAPEIQ